MESIADDNKGSLEYASKSTPPPFLLKTYKLVEDPETESIISWNENGTGFVVWQPAEFARDLLPTLFKHSNFSSFVRQLNTYGFRKVATDRWEFHNDMFRRGESELLCNIRRRKAWPNKQHQTGKNNNAAPTHDHHHIDHEDQQSPSTSSSSGYNTLVDENKRLKKENGVLSLELMSTKSKCKKLLELVGKFGNAFEKEEESEDQERPKLFGVRLDVEGEKRRRDEQRKDQ